MQGNDIGFNLYNNNNIHSIVSNKKFVNKPGEMYKVVLSGKLSSLESKFIKVNAFPNPYD